MATYPDVVVTAASESATGGDIEDEVKVVSKRAPSSHSLNSHLSSVSQASAYDYPNILGWLHFVDKNIDKRTACQLFYLGTKSEGIGEGAIEYCKRPSEFYQFLRPVYASGAQSLARFMYALRGLGKQGKYCNQQFTPKCKLQPPPMEEFEIKAKKEKEFAFHQMLVEMCVHLDRDRNLFKRLHKYICRHILIRKFYSDETAADVFLRMLHYPEILSVEKQDQLALALDQVGDAACLFILKHYRSQFDLPEIELESSLKPQQVDDNITTLPPLSSTAPSTTASSQNSQQTYPRPTTPARLLAQTPTESLKQRMGRFLPAIGDVPAEGESTFTRPPEGTGPSENTPLLEPPRPQQTDNQTSCLTVKVLVPVLIVALLIAGAGVTMMVLASIEKSNVTPRTTVYDDTTVSLGTVQRFTTSSVSIYQDPDNNEVFTPLKFYHSNDGKSCDSLPTISDVKSVENQSVPLEIQIVLLRGYLMPGSVINYTFCAVTNRLNGTEYTIALYLTNGLNQFNSFNPKTCPYSYDCNIPIVYDANLQQNDKCSHSIEHTVKRSGPYSVALLIPNEVPLSDMRLWYSQNNTLKAIDTLKMTPSCIGSPANRTNPCTISVQMLNHYISVFCVAVEVGNSTYYKFTTIRVSVKESDTGKIWFYVVGVFVASIAAISLIFTLLFFYWCKRN